jgi:hypothetical protein
MSIGGVVLQWCLTKDQAARQSAVDTGSMACLPSVFENLG